MNVISEKANDDQYLNKTTWAFSGYAEELGWRLTGKLTLMRWGQAIMFYNVNHQYPHASFHLHSLVEKWTRSQWTIQHTWASKTINKGKIMEGRFLLKGSFMSLGTTIFQETTLVNKFTRMDTDAQIPLAENAFQFHHHQKQIKQKIPINLLLKSHCCC